MFLQHAQRTQLTGDFCHPWIPPVLMVIGVMVLGVLLVLALRNRKVSTGAPTSTTGTPPSSTAKRMDDVDAAIRQVRDVQTLASDLLANAQRLSTAMDYKTRQL